MLHYSPSRGPALAAGAAHAPHRHHARGERQPDEAERRQIAPPHVEAPAAKPHAERLARPHGERDPAPDRAERHAREEIDRARADATRLTRLTALSAAAAVAGA